MRILIVTHAPLTAEFGASQIALNLGAALRAHGHDVTVWSPQPLPANTRWWQTLQVMRTHLDELLNTEETFDVVDCPSALITPLASCSTTVVARSTQPDLLYLWSGLNRTRDHRLKSLVRVPFECAHTFYHLLLVLLGWARADRIMCLGRLELRWMKRWFPWWRGKLVSYLVAPSEKDQRALAEVRSERHPLKADRLRFLWIGRWEEHKGPNVLRDFIARWNTERPHDIFTIAGCGAEAERDCPAELLRCGAIKLIPSFKRAELYPLLAEHDIGLFTSKVEGWGLSLNEMLESGMPVFATRAGGAADLFGFDGVELLPFPPRQQALLDISFGRTVSETYFKDFNWERINKKYVEAIGNPDLTDRQPGAEQAQVTNY